MATATPSKPRSRRVRIETYPHKSGGTFSYKLRWRYQNRQQSVTIKCDEEYALALVAAIERVGCNIAQDHPSVLSGSLVTGEPEQPHLTPTVREIGEEYISTRVGASEESRGRYRHTLLNGMVPILSRPIALVTDVEIRTMLVALVDAGRSAAAAFDMVRMVFNYAAYKGLLTHGNPCTYIKLPESKDPKAMFLSVAETVLLREAFLRDSSPRHGKRIQELYDCLLRTGMRESEALGLIVSDVHVDNVDDAWLDITKQLSKETLTRVPPKTKASLRRVVISADDARWFRALIDGKRGDEPVFSDPDTGGFWSQRKAYYRYTKGRKVAMDNGLSRSPRIHDTRHTFAGWCLADDVPLARLAAHLGHSNISTTSRYYGHLEKSLDDTIKRSATLRAAAMAQHATTGAPESDDTRPEHATTPKRPAPVPVRRSSRTRVAGPMRPARTPVKRVPRIESRRTTRQPLTRAA